MTCGDGVGQTDRYILARQGASLNPIVCATHQKFIPCKEVVIPYFDLRSQKKNYNQKEQKHKWS